jgi:probable rRNA maturation factor
MKKKPSRSNPFPKSPQVSDTNEAPQAPAETGQAAPAGEARVQSAAAQAAPRKAKAVKAVKAAKAVKAVKPAKADKPAKTRKADKTEKAEKTGQAGRNAPQVSLFDGRKSIPVKAEALRIEFAGGRSLNVDLSGTSGEAAVAIVAQHADPAQRATLLLRPEHFDSLTLHVFTEQVPDHAHDILRIAGEEALDDELGQPRKRPLKRHAETALELSVQYGDELDGAQRKTLPKRKAIAEWLKHSLFANAALTVRFVGAKEGRALNEHYRRKDYATNVLTFTYGDLPDGTLSSDLVLCSPVIEKEAREQGKPLIAHYAHLLVHGALHAQGYDHELGETEAAEMEAIEIEILDRLGFPNPYV